MIDEQVLKQLEYLKLLVDCEIKHEADCKKWEIPYEPSRRKRTDICEYEYYKKEIDKNGDKNLLVIGKLIGIGSGVHTTLDGKIFHFARRYVGSNLLVHKLKNGADLFVSKDDIEIIK